MAKANTLSHQVAGEAGLGDREMKQSVSWNWAGENIGEETNVTTVQGAMDGAILLQQLMFGEKPPHDGHRQNILSEHFSVVGVDVFLDQKHAILWLTQDFAQV